MNTNFAFEIYLESFYLFEYFKDASCQGMDFKSQISYSVGKLIYFKATDF